MLGLEAPLQLPLSLKTFPGLKVARMLSSFQLGLYLNQNINSLMIPTKIAAFLV